MTWPVRLRRLGFRNWDLGIGFGFGRFVLALMPVADALAAVLSGAEALPEEMVALDLAHRRILARDLAALRTQPPQAMSAMDGYAVRAADAVQAGARLTVTGESAAGRH